MKRRQLLLGLLCAPLLPVSLRLSAGHEPVIGQCEGCEAVFDGLPTRPPSRVRIAPADEPGEPLTLSGTVTDAAGRPQAGVIVYAYHTDQGGLYPLTASPAGQAAKRHGKLRAWATTDARGRYQFDSIRPGSYPDGDIPEHIHMHVIERGRATYYIDDVMFRDDPKLTPRQAKELSRGRGGSGLSIPERRNGVWFVRRDIALGMGISGYPSAEPA